MRGRQVKIFLAAMAMLALCGVAEARDFYLIIGQSNASGRGELSEMPALPNAAEVGCFRNNHVWDGACEEPVDDAAGQVFPVSADTSAEVGPGMAFGDRLFAINGGERIGLIPCAKGGSRIWQWRRNLATSSLYGACVASVQALLQQYPTLQDKILGVIYWLGETDATYALPPIDWDAEFRAFVANLRSDLNRPELAIVFVQLRAETPSDAYPAWQWVRIEQAQALARLNDPRVRMVSATGIPYQPDGIHATTAGQIIMGQRIADAMHEAQSQ